jgi:hypothetical protein
MDAQEFFKGIDWSELRNQKRTLLETIEWLNNFPANPISKQLDGIVHLIDALQDYAVDELGINENSIFDFEDEEKREKETPEETFAREMAEMVYELSVESDGIYFNIPEGMTNEEVDAITTDKYHSDIMKGDLKAKILEDVLNTPHEFERDEDGKLCYDYHLVTDYGGIVDKYVRQLFYKDKVKTLYRCPHCQSDNVEVKMWVKANTNEISSSDANNCNEDSFCNDCCGDGAIQLDTIPYLHNLVGFRVVNKSGDYHPKLKSINGALICNLYQASEMLEDVDKDGNTQWKLQSVWAEEVDESLHIFGGEPRG